MWGLRDRRCREKIFKLGLFFLYIHVYNILESLWRDNRRLYR